MIFPSSSFFIYRFSSADKGSKKRKEKRCIDFGTWIIVRDRKEAHLARSFTITLRGITTHTFFSFLRQFLFFLSLFFLLCLCLALSFKQQIILTTADRPHRWLRVTTTRETDAANIIIIDRRLTRQRGFNNEKNDGKRAPIRNWAINNSNKHHYYHHSLFFFSFIIITISYIIHICRHCFSFLLLSLSFSPRSIFSLTDGVVEIRHAPWITFTLPSMVLYAYSK